MASSRSSVGTHRAAESGPTMSQGLGHGVSTSYSIEDALYSAIDSLGGFKVVGAWLRPDLHPEAAGRWLHHCACGKKRDKLSLSQIQAIFRRAHQHGHHVGMQRLCSALGYAPAAPIAETDVIADLHRQAIAAAQLASTLSTEAMERMRAAGLNVEALGQ